MSISNTSVDKGNNHLGDLKVFGDFSLGFSSFSSPNRSYLFGSKFCSPMNLPFLHVESIIPGVFFVVFRGNPFKVVKRVVALIPVLVINFFKFVGIWYESLRHQTMNKILNWFSVSVEHNHLVSVTYKPRFKETAVRSFVARLSPYLTCRTNGVKSLVSLDMFHYAKYTNSIPIYQ